MGLILNNDGLHEVTYQDDDAIREYIKSVANNSRKGMFTSGAGQMEFVGIPYSCIDAWEKVGFNYREGFGSPEWYRKLRLLVRRDCPECEMK